jgi:hypothetical protein
MTAQQPSSPSALLARKGTASPLGLRRPRIVAEDAEQPEAELQAADQAAQGAKPNPVQLELVSGLEPAAGAAANEPPPAASLFPFSLRRALREQDDTWELVSPDLLARMAAVGREAPESSESAETEDGPASLDQTVLAAGAKPGEPAVAETAESPRTTEAEVAAASPASSAAEPEAARAPVAAKAPMALPPVGPLAKAADPVAQITPHVTGKPAAKPAAKTAGGTAAKAASGTAAKAASGAAATPVADPSWRIGVEKLPGAESSSAKRLAAMAAAAAIAVAAIAWWSYSAQDEAPGDAPAAVAGPAQQAEQNASAGNAGTASTAAPAAASAETQSAPPAAPQEKAPAATAAQEPAPAPQETAAPATQNAALPAGAPTPQPSAPAQAIAPSVDLVRIEPNGEAVIAGRAAPNTELILLDNGKPIGTVQADAFGEWVYVPEQPLNDGSHEFGLVVKSVEGKVSVPAEAPKPSATPAPTQTAPDDAAQPGPESNAGANPLTGQGGDEGGTVPLPPRKPDGAFNSDVPIPARKPALRQGQAPAGAATTGSGTGSDFVVQLASVKTHAGAQREWQKLQSRFPQYLGGMNLNLDEAKLSQRGTVVRVRTGPFSDLNQAQDFCARMLAENQDCLVLRTSGEKFSLVTR